MYQPRTIQSKWAELEVRGVFSYTGRLLVLTKRPFTRVNRQSSWLHLLSLVSKRMLAPVRSVSAIYPCRSPTVNLCMYVYALSGSTRFHASRSASA